MQPYILHVAINKPVRHCFDYLWSHTLSTEIPKPGMRVLVPFGKQQMVGVILSIDQTSCFDEKKLKPIIELLDEQPIISEKIFSLYQWASQYYQHPIGEVILGTLPTALRDKKNSTDKTLYYQLTSQGKSFASESLKRSPKQSALITLLTNKSISREAIKNNGFSNTIISTLLEKKLIEKIWIAEETPPLSTLIQAEAPLALSPEQQTAVTAVISAKNFKTFLLQGITGSGKTEVYLHIIDHHLKQGKQALILVPEIGLTPQTIARFQGRFPVHIAAFHSKLSPTERLNSWRRAQNGEAKIIIGTRSAVFTPAKKLGIIILDEEHDASFKQQSGFRYSARDLSILRGQLEKIPVILGTATPSLETLHNAHSDRFELLTLPFRAGNATPPIFRTVDIRGQYLEEGLSSQLLHAMKIHLAEDNQALLFLNRRGYAPVLLCRTCGWSASCHRCDAKFTVHQFPPRLICHHCISSTSIPKQCSHCQSNELINIGIGTEKVEAALKKHFPDIDILRIDRDTIRHKNDMQKILEKIKHGKRQILIGTQMLAKGHHFPNVTLVGILDIDSGFYSTDFRAVESTGQLITQVAGRAGRAEKPGEVYLQTYQPDHPLLNILLEEGYHSFSQHLLMERKNTGWPPFSFLALLRAEATHKEKPLHFLTEAKRAGEKLPHPHIQLLGPIPAPMHKKAGNFRAIFLIQSSQRKTLQAWLNKFIPVVDALPSGKKVRWSLDVDPLEMF